MILIPVSPVSTTRGVALVRGGGRHGLVECDVPSYPLTDEARDFRRARIAAGVNVRRAAARIGVRASEVSDVERGAKVPEDWGDWWERSMVPR